MAKVLAFHSPEEKVYHDNNLCIEGNEIEPENLLRGTGGKPLCKHCAELV